MKSERTFISASAVSSVGAGLVLMGVFTCFWTGVAYAGLWESSSRFTLIVFPVFALTFLITGLRMYGTARNLPKLTSEADIAEEVKAGKRFGIIFAAEGLGILIGINVVKNIGHPELTIPVIALVVGLHFYPLAKVFKRTADYYLATWSTIVAVCSMVFMLNKTYPSDAILAFTGIGLALATTCYGFNMLYRAQAIKRMLLQQKN